MCQAYMTTSTPCLDAAAESKDDDINNDARTNAVCAYLCCGHLNCSDVAGYTICGHLLPFLIVQYPAP